VTARPKDELLTASGIAGWCLVAGLTDVLEKKGLLSADDAIEVVASALSQLDEIKGLGTHEAFDKARVLLAGELANRKARAGRSPK
jgi:hypothetical protein